MSGMRNARLQRHFTHIGFRGVDGKPLGEAEIFKLRHELFNRDNIQKKASKEVAAVQESLRVGNISQGNAQRQTRQIELARDKILALLARKERSLMAAEIRHERDFRVLGLSQPVFINEEITQAYMNQKSKDLSSSTKRDADIAVINLIMSLWQLRSPITRSRANVYTKIRELSTKYSKELEMFDILPNRRDTFSFQQLENAGAKIDSLVTASPHSMDNPRYEEMLEAYNRIYRAAEELESSRFTDSWDRAMFDAIIARRVTLLQEAELLDVEKALQRLDIDLVDGKVSSRVWGRIGSKMPSFQLSGQWEQVVAEQHQLVAAKYRDNFSGAELQDKLQELNTAKDSLLSFDIRSALQDLLMRVHSENFYRSLDLDPAQAEAYTAREVKQAFHRMAKRYHPDSNHGATGVELGVLNELFSETTRIAKILQDASVKGRIDAQLRN